MYLGYIWWTRKTEQCKSVKIVTVLNVGPGIVKKIGKKYRIVKSHLKQSTVKVKVNYCGTKKNSV